jgi:hypothetical protein
MGMILLSPLQFGHILYIISLAMTSSMMLIEVVRVDIFVLFLILEEILQVFTGECEFSRNKFQLMMAYDAFHSLLKVIC